jgi:predicted Zn-dependent peptidase
MSLLFRRFAGAVITAAALVGAPGLASAEATLPAPVSPASRAETYALANGLQVVLDEDHRAPLVGISVMYRVGRADDPPGRRGLAEVIARILDSASTRHLPREEARASLFQALTVHPFRPHTEAFAENTTLTVLVPSHALPLALWLEGDRLGFFTDGISQEQIAWARSGADEAMQRRDASSFTAELSSAQLALVGPEHPYSRLFAGGKSELDGLTIQEVRARCQRLYQAGNATLVLSGDFVPAAVKPLIAEYFGALPATARGAVADPPRPDLTAERRSTVEITGARRTVLFAWPTPPLYDDDDRKLDALARILEARLGAVLVRERRAADEIGVHERSLRRASVFTVTVKVAAASTSDEVIKLVDLELSRLRAAPPSDVEIAAARDSLVLGLVSQYEAVADRSRALAAFTFNGGGTDGLPRSIVAYSRVDGGALQQLAQRYLPADRRVVIQGNPHSTGPLSYSLTASR